MFSKQFLLDMTERAIKTIAQTVIASLLASGALGLFDANWGDILSVAGLAGVISLLTSIASSGTGDSDSASLVNNEGDIYG